MKNEILSNEELASIANLVLRKTTLTIDGNTLINPDEEIAGILSKVEQTSEAYRERILLCLQAIVDAELGYGELEREYTPVGFKFPKK